MCELNFCALFLRTTLLLIAVRCVLCEKTDSVDVNGLKETEEIVELMVDSLGRELSNSSFSEILNFWDEGSGRDAKSLQETPNDPSPTVESKSSRKDSKFGNVSGGGHGGAAGGQKKRKGQKKQQSLVKRIMPLMFIPFMISTAIIPLMIFVIKLLFMKAAIVGKVAVTLGLISFFKRRTSGGGVYNYNAWKMR